MKGFIRDLLLLLGADNYTGQTLRMKYEYFTTSGFGTVMIH